MKGTAVGARDVVASQCAWWAALRMGVLALGAEVIRWDGEAGDWLIASPPLWLAGCWRRSSGRVVLWRRSWRRPPPAAGASTAPAPSSDGLP